MARRCIIRVTWIVNRVCALQRNVQKIEEGFYLSLNYIILWFSLLSARCVQWKAKSLFD